MHSLMKVTAALTVLGACGSGVHAGRACTDVGAASGVGLDIAPPVAARVARASMTVCHDGACRTSAVLLTPSTTARPEGCSGGACGALAVPTGGRHGFGDFPALPKRPVRVTVVLRNTSGRRLLDQSVTVSPKGVFPNGPHCGEAGPQARVVVTAGRLRGA
jgi:hypothetical protein